MENRSGLIVDTRLMRISGHAERLAGALDMSPTGRARSRGGRPWLRRIRFVEELRGKNVRPRVAQNMGDRRSAINKRTKRHPGYA